MTHPFHPLFGREFELAHWRQCWGDDRVFYVDADEQLRSLPACWTSAVVDDLFVTISAGRSPFRVSDLIDLTKLVRGEER